MCPFAKLMKIPRSIWMPCAMMFLLAMLWVENSSAFMTVFTKLGGRGFSADFSTRYPFPTSHPANFPSSYGVSRPTMGHTHFGQMSSSFCLGHAGNFPLDTEPSTSSTTELQPDPVANPSHYSSTRENPSLPWQTSVQPDRDMIYMPLLEKQLDLMEHLGYDQKILPPEMSLRISKIKPAKIGNLEFEGGPFRKIRVTYFDAGDGVQVYNTLW